MKITYIFLALAAGLITSCNSGSQNSLPVSNGNQQIHTNANGSIGDLDQKIAAEICGLWKRYKTVYPSGDSYVERDNSFIEIKANRTFEKDGYKGKWIITFGKDSLGATTLFTILQSYYRNDNDVKVESYKLEKAQENNTTYLKFIALADGRQLYYIRQQ